MAQSTDAPGAHVFPSQGLPWSRMAQLEVCCHRAVGAQHVDKAMLSGLHSETFPSATRPGPGSTGSSQHLSSKGTHMCCILMQQDGY